jgi:DNA-binding XRE family transcriptional regulator
MWTRSRHNALIWARFSAGLTQAELAAAVCSTRKTIGMIEQEQRIPSVSLALAIARALDRDVESLFGSAR